MSLTRIESDSSEIKAKDQAKGLKESIQKKIKHSIIECIKAKLEGQAQARQRIFNLVNDLWDKNELSSRFVNELVEAVDSLEKIMAEQRRYLYANVTDISCVKDFIEKLSSQGFECLKNEKHEVKVELKFEAIKLAVKEYSDVKFSKVDKRNQIDSKLIRRMDSLARLFALTSIKSVCSAVAFHDGELIVAANLSKEKERDAVISDLHNRIKVLCNFINYIKFHVLLRLISETGEIDLYTEVENEAKNLYKNNYESCSVLPEDLIIQAITKVTHAVVFDKSLKGANNNGDNFLLSETVKYRILLPEISQNQYAQISIITAVTSGDSIEELSRSSLEINGLTCYSVASMHAEQLIARYVFHSDNNEVLYNEKNKLRIGVSKLCCGTCYKNLESLPIEVRGCHYDIYPETLNLIDVENGIEKASQKTPRRHETAANNSPKKTPWKANIPDNAFFAKFSNVEPKSKRKLDFSPEENNHGCVNKL